MVLSSKVLANARKSENEIMPDLGTITQLMHSTEPAPDASTDAAAKTKSRYERHNNLYLHFIGNALPEDRLDHRELFANGAAKNKPAYKCLLEFAWDIAEMDDLPRQERGILLCACILGARYHDAPDGVIVALVNYVHKNEKQNSAFMAQVCQAGIVFYEDHLALEQLKVTPYPELDVNIKYTMYLL